MNAERSIEDSYGLESHCRKRRTVHMKVVIEQRVDSRLLMGADALDRDNIEIRMMLITNSKDSQPSHPPLLEEVSGNVTSLLFVTDQTHEVHEDLPEYRPFLCRLLQRQNHMDSQIKARFLAQILNRARGQKSFV